MSEANRAGSLAGSLGEFRAGAADVPLDELAQYNRAFGSCGLSCGPQFLPVVVVDGDCALRGLPRLRWHVGKVSDACALPQRRWGRVAHIHGCCHGLSVAVGQGIAQAACTGSAQAITWLGKRSTNPRQLGGTSGISGNRVSVTGVVLTTLVVVPDEHAQDLTDPRCERHLRAATFVVTWDDPAGGPRRETPCDDCIADVMRDAVLTGHFTPPAVSPIDLDLYRPWKQAVAS